MDKYINLAGLQYLWNKIKMLLDSKLESIPVATDSVLGGVKVGDGLTVSDDGVLSAPSSPVGIMYRYTFDENSWTNTSPYSFTVLRSSHGCSEGICCSMYILENGKYIADYNIYSDKNYKLYIDQTSNDILVTTYTPFSGVLLISGTSANTAIPLGSNTQAGLLQVGAGLTVSEGVVGIDASTIEFSPEQLPVANNTDKGVVRVGDGLSIDESGLLSAPPPDAADILLADGVDVETAMTNLFTSASNVKTSVASAITGRGGTATENMTGSQLADAITNLPTLEDMTSDATAAASDILAGKTAYSQGVKLTGTASSGIPELVQSISYTGTYATSTYFVQASSGVYYAANGNIALVMKSGTSTTYENLTFSLSSAPTGVSLAGQSVYNYSSASSGSYYVAVLSGITSPVNITISMSSRNSTYDYVICAISIASA